MVDMRPNIKLLILDVDGTLTDGNIYYSDGGLEMKTFSVKDGAVINCLPQLGIRVIFLTGRKSEAVARRATELSAEAIQGVENKALVVRKMIEDLGITYNQIAYIGDDLNDYAAMQLCGFKACPADASEEIKEICDYVSSYQGGHGAVRDICKYLLTKLSQWEEMLHLFH